MPVNVALPPSRTVCPDAIPVISARAAWWLWPHLLSLDAPAVAMVWQQWWAHSTHVTLWWCHAGILGLGVWLIYLSDRLVDASRMVQSDPVRPRHAFHEHGRRGLSICAAIAAGALIWLTLSMLPRVEFRDGLILLAFAVLYFWLIHGRSRQSWTVHLPKEAAVGGLFAVGTVFFPWCRNALPPHVLPLAVALFGGICFCNCALITVWEQHAQDRRNPTSLLNAFPRLSVRLRQICLLLAGLAGASALLTGSNVFVPLASSGVLLAMLDRYRGRFSANALRILADVALLTPLITLPWSWH